MPRILITSITFPYSENAEIERDAAHRSFPAANAALRKAAFRAPERGYHKTDVTVQWMGGETFTWRFDLKAHHAHEVDPIGAELRDMAEKYAGLKVPPRFTRAGWECYLDELKIDRAVWRERVDHYQLSERDMVSRERTAALQEES